MTSGTTDAATGAATGGTVATGAAPWTATVLTIFPEMFPGPLASSLAGRALTEGMWQLDARDLRDHADAPSRSVDLPPFGGGPGMVIRPEVIDAALAAVTDAPGSKIFLTPRGARLDQKRIRDLASGDGVVLLCGRYEGVDQRAVEANGLEEVSLGDFILSGGEPAAIALIDACVRLLPGVVGDAASLAEESFENGLLEHPHYTKPANWRNRAVPAVLLSGHHQEIRHWRHEQACRTTRDRRPDLWARHQATMTAGATTGATGTAGDTTRDSADRANKNSNTDADAGAKRRAGHTGTGRTGAIR